MRQILSWILSLAVHAALAVALVLTVDFTPPDLEKIMEVDLARVEEPQIIEPLPQLPPPPPEPAEIPEPEAPPVAETPLPLDKTVVLNSPPPPEAPAPEAQPEPDQPADPIPDPEVVEISPVKTETPVPPEPEITDTDEDAPRKVQVRKDFTVHRGHEARFGRALMGDYFSYSTQEFSGHFKTRDNRTISIIDARNTKYGRFLIYDSKNKTLRRMKRAFGKYVYTIGPSLYADEPVCGSVTFLAKDDRIERFILVTDDDRLAHYPRKVHVREKELCFPGPAGEITANLSQPPYGDGHPGMVVIHGPDCVDPALIQGFTRALSMYEISTLAFAARGCLDETPTAAGNTELTADTVAALHFLKQHPQMDETKVGLWGNGAGIRAAIHAAEQAKPRFLVCLISDATDPKSLPDRNVLARLDMPVLWLITGRHTRDWVSQLKVLEELRDKSKKPFSIIIAPLKASEEVLEAESDQSSWVEQVAEDHAQLAVNWIETILGK